MLKFIARKIMEVVNTVPEAVLERGIPDFIMSETVTHQLESFNWVAIAVLALKEPKLLESWTSSGAADGQPAAPLPLATRWDTFVSDHLDPSKVAPVVVDDLAANSLALSVEAALCHVIGDSFLILLKDFGVADLMAIITLARPLVRRFAEEVGWQFFGALYKMKVGQAGLQPGLVGGARSAITTSVKAWMESQRFGVYVHNVKNAGAGLLDKVQSYFEDEKRVAPIAAPRQRATGPRPPETAPDLAKKTGRARQPPAHATRPKMKPRLRGASFIQESVEVGDRIENYFGVTEDAEVEGSAHQTADLLLPGGPLHYNTTADIERGAFLQLSQEQHVGRSFFLAEETVKKVTEFFNDGRSVLVKTITSLFMGSFVSKFVPTTAILDLLHDIDAMLRHCAAEAAVSSVITAVVEQRDVDFSPHEVAALTHVLSQEFHGDAEFWKQARWFRLPDELVSDQLQGIEETVGAVLPSLHEFITMKDFNGEAITKAIEDAITKGVEEVDKLIKRLKDKIASHGHGNDNRASYLELRDQGSRPSAFAQAAPSPDRAARYAKKALRTRASTAMPAGPAAALKSLPGHDLEVDWTGEFSDPTPFEEYTHEGHLATALAKQGIESSPEPESTSQLSELPSPDEPEAPPLTEHAADRHAGNRELSRSDAELPARMPDKVSGSPDAGARNQEKADVETVETPVPQPQK
ncbi:unnamed protein product [Amoebophrya sp. A120]|nr:unnamed protein product [Amoebophrya sp. A120]|eukprot:GSA120T00005206001.1